MVESGSVFLISAGSISENLSEDLIFDKIENVPKAIEDVSDKNFIYGYVYRKPARALADIILQILRINGTEYSIKSIQILYERFWL